MTNWKALSACGVLTALLAGAALTQTGQPGADDKKKPGKEPAKKPATHKVEKKPFRVELTSKGILEPEQTIAVAHRPQPAVGTPYSPGPLTIHKVVEHGARIKRGDTLIAFDSRRV